MLIRPSFFKQAYGVRDNLGKKVTLKYSDDYIFIKKLDRLISQGITIKIVFDEELMEQDCDLDKRIFVCKDGGNIQEQLLDLAISGIKIIYSVKSGQIVKSIKQIAQLDRKCNYSSYCVSFDFDESTKRYFLLLKPISNGMERKFGHLLLC
ncbi:hypothetical protein [Photobacterium kishitanii]|uniref:hypothetical protein n=1 Tax=Photobacterium kishitanii TaxID=318456 RepID=UPI00071AF090|nr:hypothetical protein [Photobacterium kishitanii]